MLLDVGDGNQVWYEVAGSGKPLLVIHGGPGAGSPTGTAKAFDPQRWQLIHFDQRGCGRSTPSAADPATDMSVNTTAHLLRDIELLRLELGLERWTLFGGSWGATLALAYAERHPERIAEIVLVAVTTSRREEIDWLYRGVGRFFPEAWERFAAFAGERDDPVAAYARLIESPDRDVRLAAAREWMRWEDAVVGAEPHGQPGTYSDRSEDELLTFVRICAHYFSNYAFLDDGVLLREAHRLAGIPGVLIHGRLDMSAPLRTAWKLAQAWPGAELVVVDDSGHQGSPAMAAAVCAAAERVAPGLL